MLGPEVEEDQEGEPLGRRNQPLIEELLRFDAVVIAGQAKSHCVAWTIQDLLHDPTVQERGLEEKVYLLEDCTSPVVVPAPTTRTTPTPRSALRGGRRARRALDGAAGRVAGRRRSGLRFRLARAWP